MFALACLLAASAGPPTVQPVLYTTSTKLTIRPALHDVGSGGAVVELHMTRDGGRSWERVSESVDATGTIGVNLPEDGRYGFTLVARSKAGRGEPRPKAGDEPQRRVVVDRTPPEAVLHMPLILEAADGDRVRFTWKAEDQNLSPNPVTLLYRRTPDEQWRTIVHTRNTGSYDWKPPADLPGKVYLSLRVRDLAGNVSEATTPEPIPIDLARPRATIAAIEAGR